MLTSESKKIKKKSNLFLEENYILDDLKQKNLYRSLVECDADGSNYFRKNGKKLISFCSNDYLGLSQNFEVKKAAIEAIKKFGVGSGSSRYISGNNSLYSKLEKEIAIFKNCDDAIVFSSGYSCAIGVIPALVGDKDLIIADKLIHSSLFDGSRLSGAKLIRFLHNDLNHARKILEENRNKFKKCLIITETIFSMDGDLGRIKELSELAKEFDCILISDDAHGFGFNLENNRKENNKLNIQLGTLSKAFGTLGGYVAANKNIIDYLRNFAKSQIYSTALPPSILAATIKALKIIKKNNQSKKVLENAKLFCGLMNLDEPQSAIVPIIIGDNKKVLEIAKKVEDCGFLISAIRHPTVEKNKARLRISFSVFHKKKDIKKLAEVLKKIINNE
jgi:8-amino-7-oxononanoate synthase